MSKNWKFQETIDKITYRFPGVTVIDYCAYAKVICGNKTVHIPSSTHPDEVYTYFDEIAEMLGREGLATVDIWRGKTLTSYKKEELIDIIKLLAEDQRRTLDRHRLDLDTLRPKRKLVVSKVPWYIRFWNWGS